MRLGRHEKWWIAHWDAYYSELKWFHEPSLCFSNKSMWAPVKGVFKPQNWKALNSRLGSCMWIRISIYIQSCTYYLIWHSRDGILMWFLTSRKDWCYRNRMWYFEMEEWWCLFLREWFPRELSDVLYYTHIIRIMSLSHTEWGRYHSAMFETNGLSSLNQFWIFKIS